MTSAGPYPPPQSGAWREALGKHSLFAAMLGLMLLVGLWRALNAPEFMLQFSDFNAVKVPALFWERNLPALDDFEVGHLRYHLALSSIYYSVPLLLSRLGVPGEAFVVAHLLLGQTFLLCALYHLGRTLFADARAAAFCAAGFFFNSYWLFIPNLGYQIFFDLWPYHNDLCHPLNLLLISYLLRGRFLPAAACAALATGLNVTTGLSAGLLLGGCLVLEPQHSAGAWRQRLVALAVGAAGLAYAVGMVLLLPKGVPAPTEARDLAIMSYGHIVIHRNLKLYLIALGFMAACLAYALYFEQRLRPRLGLPALPNARRLLLWALAVTLLFGLGAYWTSYALSPTAFIALSPSKWFVVLCLLLAPYALHALYSLCGRSPLFALALALAFGLSLLREADMARHWFMATLAMALAAALLRRSCAQPHPHLWLTTAMCCLALASWSVTASQPLREGRLAVAADLRSISEKIDQTLPQDALFVQYGLPGARTNFVGSFSHLALRTYSHRGYIPYWSLGRNAYFNSAIRHDFEERAYAAAGLPCWDDLLRQSREARAADPLGFVTGFRSAALPSLNRALGEVTPWTLLNAKVDTLQSTLAAYTPDQFAAYARSIGGTHLLVAKDPGMTVPFPAQLESAYFAVVDLGRIGH